MLARGVGPSEDIAERRRGVTQIQGSVEFDFKDSWRFEIAAYELDKLLDLNMVPPTVERTVNGHRGSVQLWIEGAISEAKRRKDKIQVPNPIAWNRQIWKVRVFDDLIFNIDRVNINNLLITPDWKICLIDHSRTFKSMPDLKSPKDLTDFSLSLMKISRTPWQRHPGFHCRILLQFQRRRFNGNFSLQGCVLSQVDHSHAALPQLFDHPVVRNGLAELEHKSLRS